MKVAMPVWEGRISPVFDVSRRLLVAEVKEGIEVDRCEVPLEEESLPHRAGRMVDLGADVLICGGISRSLADALNVFKIRVVSGTTGEMKQVLTAYFRGELPGPQFAMPGYRAPRRHRGGIDPAVEDSVEVTVESGRRGRGRRGKRAEQSEGQGG